MRSPTRLARAAGVLYLAMFLLGGAAHLVVRADVYVAGDAASTTSNLVAEAGLFRAALVADIGMATAFALLGAVLHRLLGEVDRSAATAMLVFVGVGAGMILTNLGFHHASMLVATDPAIASAIGTDGAAAITLVLMDLHHHGYALAGVFFGLWLLPLGYLVVRSGAFPRPLGYALIAAGVSWIAHTVLGFAIDLPAVVHALHTVLTLAELWMVLYLVVRGVRSSPAPGPATVTVGSADR
jgi:hypothetical protein